MASRDGHGTRSAAPGRARGGIHASHEISADEDGCTRDLPAWSLDAFHAIRAIVADDDFPCIFARRSLNLDAWYFTFVDSFVAQAGRRAVAESIATYLQQLDPDPGAPILMPLLIVERPVHPVLELADYHRRGWDLLQWLNDDDPGDWPAASPVDPDDNEWSFHYRGQPLFINFSCPVHRYFRSRNLGDSMVLVLQRATNFDAVTSYDWNGPKGHAVRSVIRSRIERFEGHAAPIELTRAGSPDERAWKQMAIPEPDGTYPTECPFRARVRRRDDDDGDEAGGTKRER